MKPIINVMMMMNDDIVEDMNLMMVIIIDMMITMFLIINFHNLLIFHLLLNTRKSLSLYDSEHTELACMLIGLYIMDDR
jgi:hypothetical protein